MNASHSPLLLAIDQGTTSSRAILFTPTGEIVAVAQKELQLYYPQPGWVEQRASDLWEDTLQCCRDVFSQQAGGLERTAAIGITNQRETTILWDRNTGEAIHNAIVWQDRRTADHCDRLRDEGKEALVGGKTGLLLDPYFSATKVAWMLDNVDGARERAQRGELAFGTVDSYLLWRLTGGAVHATDASNACRSLLFNIVEQRWDEELLELCDIPASLLPEVRDNVAAFGQSESSLFGKSLTIGAMAGDQHAAMIGQACFDSGSVKSTYGTGCFMLMNVGEKPVASQHRLLSTMAYRIDGKPVYALEGSIFVAGAAIQWLRDGLELFVDAAETEAMALSVDNNQDVYFVPALTGLGAPHWRADARGLITGLARDTGRAHIVRAALEAQAYQTRDLVDAMSSDSGIALECIRADGGLVQNNFVCQFLADILGASIQKPEITEATAWGAAALAGLQCGLFSSLKDITRVWREAERFERKMPATEADACYEGWCAAMGRLTGR